MTTTRSTQDQLARLIKDGKRENKRLISLDDLDAILRGF